MSEVKVIQVLHHDSETDQTYTAEVIEKKDFDLLSQKLELAMAALRFYANVDNWMCTITYPDKTELFSEIDSKDFEPLSKRYPKDLSGGKTAREAIRKIEAL